MKRSLGGTVTKNQNVIQTIAISLLLITSQAFAQTTVRPVHDPALIVFFNKLFKGSAFRCAVDSGTKVSVLSRLEDRCLVRASAQGQSYISGYKSGCDEYYVRTSVERNIDQICDRKLDQLNVRNGSGQIESSSVAQAAKNAKSKSSLKDTAKDLNKTYKDFEDKAGDLEKISANKDKYINKAKDAVGMKTDEKPVVAAEAPKVTSPQSAPAMPSGGSTAETRAKMVADEKAFQAGQTGGGSTAPSTSVAPSAQGGFTDSSVDKFGTKTTEYQSTDGHIVRVQEYKDGGGIIEKIDPKTGEIVKGDMIKPGSTKDQVAAMGADTSQPTKTPDRAAADAAQAEQGANDALKDAPASTKKEANDTVLGDKAKAEAKNKDPKTAQAEKTAEADANQLDQKFKKTVQPAESQVHADKNCQTELQEAKQAFESYKQKRISCEKSSAMADNFCDKVRSPKAMQVQKWITLGTASLSKVTAASEACEATSNISKVAQAGILGAQAICTGLKFKCDFSCHAARGTLSTFKKANEALKVCAAQVLQDSDAHDINAAAATVPAIRETQEQLAVEAKAYAQSIENVSANLDQMVAQESELATVVDVVASDGKVSGKSVQGGSSVEHAFAICGVKNNADIMTFGLQAAGFLSAHLDAKKCKEQLSAGSGGGSKSKSAGPVNLSTAEFCSSPANAQSLTCKCTNDPNADGCLGAVAKGGYGLGKIGDGKGVSAFASTKTNGLTTLDGGLGSLSGSSDGASDSQKAGLSDAAKQALGLSQGSGSGYGGSSGGSLNKLGDGAEIGDKKTNSKNRFGFLSKLESLFKGSGSNSKKPVGTAGISYGDKSEREKAIKRKIASDQWRSEVSTASGKSNFDKIRSCYQYNAGSFEQ